MNRLFLLAIGAVLTQAMTTAASAGHSFTNATSIGLRCRLSSDTRDTAVTFLARPMRTITVAGTYRDVRCDEPVLRQRWPLTDGSQMTFQRERDGRISLQPG